MKAFWMLGCPHNETVVHESHAFGRNRTASCAVQGSNPSDDSVSSCSQDHECDHRISGIHADRLCHINVDVRSVWTSAAFRTLDWLHRAYDTNPNSTAQARNRNSLTVSSWVRVYTRHSNSLRKHRANRHLGVYHLRLLSNQNR